MNEEMMDYVQRLEDEERQRSAPRLGRTIGEAELLERLEDAVARHRAALLDFVEAVFGQNENWKFARKKLLSLCGDRGISGELRAILNAEFDGNQQSKQEPL